MKKEGEKANAAKASEKAGDKAAAKVAKTMES